ncbi:MAG: zinc finger Ran-binding domain-containing family 2 protein [Spirochaetales bacterium]|nr:zinc finger Ran-binding domain-containing family 2 protein [Spirochaetales bacterium]
MLDILVIVLFSKQIGRWAEKKGYKRGMYQGLVIGAWFTGEILGLIAGIFLLADMGEDAIYLAIFPALLGAGAGIMTMVFVVKALPFRAFPAATGPIPAAAEPVRAPREQAPVEPWTCPNCGYHNTYKDTYCFNCKKEKLSAPG